MRIIGIDAIRGSARKIYSSMLQYRAVLFVLLVAAFQFTMYLILYGDPLVVLNLIYYSEIVWYAKSGLLEPEECRHVIGNLLFPDTMIYSYPATIVAVYYLSRFANGLALSKKFLAIYIVVMIIEFYLSVGIMDKFRGGFPHSIPYHIVWMIDDFIVFYVIFKIFEYIIGLIRYSGVSLASDKGPIYTGAVLYAWIAVLLGWIIPWVIYGAVFYYVVSPICGDVEEGWLQYLRTLAEKGLPAVAIITGAITGIIYAIHRLTSNTYEKDLKNTFKGETKRKVPRNYAIGATVYSNSINILAIKSLLTKISLVVQEGIFDITISFISMVFYVEGFYGLVIFYASLSSFWTSAFFMAQDLYIRRYGKLVFKEG